MISSDNSLAFRVDDYCRKVGDGGSFQKAHVHDVPNIVIVEQVFAFFCISRVSLVHRIVGIDTEVFFI